jgi:hypothetical protein
MKKIGERKSVIDDYGDEMTVDDAAVTRTGGCR